MRVAPPTPQNAKVAFINLSRKKVRQDRISSTIGKATKFHRMRTTQQFSITLPHDMAEVVEAKIKSGAYASVSDVMRDGVRALIDRDAAVEKWLREEVVAGHQEYLADPSKGVLAEALLERIKGRREKKQG